MLDLFGLALRISIIYLYTLAFLRLTGKRSIGELSPLDFIVALIIGDLFDDVMFSEVTVPEGMVAIGTIILLHALVAFVTYQNRTASILVNPEPALIIEQGRFNPETLEKERLSEEEALRAVRFNGEESPEPASKGYLETSGTISLLLKRTRKPVQKEDLPRLKDLFS